ncbi:MAG: DUF262 domain-containing protein [Phycisphaerales bacterium]
MLADRQLNLAPDFQRKSVWSVADRRRLIETVLQGWPMPAIFLRRRRHEGRDYFDVLDGKQRLESIFMFIGARGFGRKSFDVRWPLGAEQKPERRDWTTIRRHLGEVVIMSYSVPVIEVECDSLASIVELFVRINSTGKPLTRSEKMNAKFYRSGLLRACAQIARKQRRMLMKHGVIKEVHVNRMKDVEFITELLVSMLRGAPVNKKDALDRVLSEAVDGRSLKRLTSGVVGAMKLSFSALPDLQATRFRNHSDFYSLVFALWSLSEHGLVLKDRTALRRAAGLLRRLSGEVDAAIEIRRRSGDTPGANEVGLRYLAAVERSSDNAVQRGQRHEILVGLLEGLFGAKDTRRTFSAEQRRLLWQSDEAKRCRSCGCALDWSNFQVDHVVPHSRGGGTTLRNAQLMCGSCNARKGNRRGKGRAR